MENSGTRRYRSKQERRQIVEETLKPGASVSLVARAHDINANQIFNWRRQYRTGQLDVVDSTGPLVPVKIAGPAIKGNEPAPGRSKPAVMGLSRIEVDLGHARIQIETSDPECVRAAVEGLR